MALITCPKCGNQVSDKAEKCPKCGWIVPNISQKNLSTKKVNISKRNLFIIILLVIIGVILISLIINKNKLANRYTFPSEKEMQEALQGIYPSEKGSSYLIINNDECIYRWETPGWSGYTMTEDIEWHPDKGTFTTFEDIIVTKNGELISDDNTYIKGEIVYPEKRISYADSIYFTIGIDDIMHNQSYTTCHAHITNETNSQKRIIEVLGSFIDIHGNIADTDITTVYIPDGLDPGETEEFSISIPKNEDIISCAFDIMSISY